MRSSLISTENIYEEMEMMILGEADSRSQI